MPNLSFDENIKEYTINNDPGRVLRVNMSDFGLLGRISDAAEKAKELQGKYNDIDESAGFESFVKWSREIDTQLRSIFDGVFGEGASKIVFMDQNLLSTTSSGKSIMENFMEAFTEMVKPELEAAFQAASARVGAYKTQYDSFAA